MSRNVPPIDIPKIIEQYGERIGRAAWMLTGDAWEADDLKQETFLIASQNADRFQGRSQLYTWLYGILLNVDRRRRRKQEVRQRALANWIDQRPDKPASTPAAEAAAIVDEWKKGLWSRVHQLPEGQRQSLVLRFSEGLKYEEIAEILDCPSGTVKSRVYHGLLALRKQLEQEGDSWKSPPTDTDQDVDRHVI